jgi:hypothetical protein
MTRLERKIQRYRELELRAFKDFVSACARVGVEEPLNTVTHWAGLETARRFHAWRKRNRELHDRLDAPPALNR